MITDYERAAKRLSGFNKKYKGNADTSTFLEWIKIIVEDDEKSREVYFRKRFEGFQTKEKKFLQKYETEIVLLHESGMDSISILEKLKGRFIAEKYFVELSTLVRFVNRLKRFSGVTSWEI
jgi:hypothetical protein